MKHHHTAARASIPLALAAALAATLLAGCGGSADALASKSPAAILAASRTAAEHASSVHVMHDAAQGRLSLTSDLELTSDGGRARTSLLGVTGEVIRIGSIVYAKSDNPAFYRHLLSRSGVHVSQGAWVKEPSAAQRPLQTDLSRELSLLLDSSGPLTKGPVTTIDGQKVIELKDSGKLFTRSIYIAATGEPYPVETVKHGRETGQTTFSGWNEPIPLSAPVHAIELSELGGAGAANRKTAAR